jgi:hypothetical protein
MPHSEIQIPCQKHNLKWLDLDYIYLISYKIAKKANPRKISLPLLKNDITGSEPTVKIVDI